MRNHSPSRGKSPIAVDRSSHDPRRTSQLNRSAAVRLLAADLHNGERDIEGHPQIGGVMTPLHTLAIVLLLPLAGPPRDFRMFDGPRIPAEFNQRVADYVETHRRVAAAFENPSMCSR